MLYQLHIKGIMATILETTDTQPVLDEKSFILVAFSLMIVPYGPSNNNPILV